MDEYYSPSTVEQRKKKSYSGSSTSSGSTPSRNAKNHRHPVVDDDDEDSVVNPIECSGKSCRACSGGVIADCVAVCCCPCAVVNILALTFLKIPWMVAKKCLRMAKKKKNVESSVGELVGISGIMSNTSSFGEDELIKDSFHETIHDAEEVWLELYQVGHMGFGRVSFTGIN